MKYSVLLRTNSVNVVYRDKSVW